uniref:Uncharacterized protein n=1 Tax=Triticum urartu TaxID=4572 RepID=A0A8R7JWU5_TRIUA
SPSSLLSSPPRRHQPSSPSHRRHPSCSRPLCLLPSHRPLALACLLPTCRARGAGRPHRAEGRRHRDRQGHRDEVAAVAGMPHLP